VVGVSASEPVRVQTSPVRDADAGPVGQGVCVVTTRLTDAFVQVLGTDGGVIASGKAGDVPLCRPKG